MSGRKKPLRWRREPRATGLASVTQGARGFELRRGNESLAWVYPLTEWPDRWTVKGWYFVARVGEQHINTWADPVATPEEAKAAARAYVDAHS